MDNDYEKTRVERFRQIVDTNVAYYPGMNVDLVTRMYIKEYLKYTNPEFAQTAVSKVFDFLDIPNNMTFEQRMCYYQLMENNNVY